jgi:hypothetical protein
MATEMKRTRSGRFTSESESPDPLSDPIEDSVPPGEVGEDDEWLSEDEGTVKNKGGKGKGKTKAKTPTAKQKTPVGTSTNFGQRAPPPHMPGPVPVNPIDPATFQNSMYQMMQLLTSSITTQAAATRTSASPGPFGVKEPKVKDPETFNGQRDQLNSFLTECTLVFELQPSRFPDDKTKVNYMISLLRGTALMAIRPHLSGIIRPLFLQIYDDFVAYLKTNFGDPDEKGTARRKLKVLRQTNSASAYFAEFQQYIAILGWIDQDPIVDKAIDGLKPMLKDELARSGRRPDTLTELIDFIIPLDNRLYEREQERKREQKDDKDVKPRQVTENTRSTTTTSTTVQQSSANLGNGQVQQQPLRQQGTFVNTFQRASSNPTSGGPRGPLTNEERQKRLAEGRCLYCGDVGHISRDCEVAKARNTRIAQLKGAVEGSENYGEGNEVNPSD